MWHSPNPRYVLLADKLHVPRSLDKQMRRAPYEIVFDTRFEAVMRGCATARRPGQRGTWITRDMLRAYVRLHELGFAHSAEAYEGERLVGGLYGVSIGAVFFGESMFARSGDASKIAFVTLARHLRRWGIDLIDCQVKTAHLERFGGESWPRSRYLAELRRRLDHETKRGRWSVEPEETPKDAP